MLKKRVPFRPLDWKSPNSSILEATVGDFFSGDGIRFSLTFRQSKHIKGRWRLSIDTFDSGNKWGGLDYEDHPPRWFHLKSCAKAEAEAIASRFYQRREVLKNLPKLFNGNV